MFRVSLVVSVLVLALAAPAAFAYNVVSASSPYCVFGPSCSVYVSDYSYSFSISGAAGTARLQSRISNPLPGKYLYQYRMILTDAYGIVYTPYVDQMAIQNFGPVLQYDYNGDSVATDHVFWNTTSLGTVPISTSTYFFGWTYFNFASPIYTGSGPGNGQSSRLFGLTSDYAPVIRNISVHTDSGWVTVQGYAPQYP